MQVAVEQRRQRQQLCPCPRHVRAALRLSDTLPDRSHLHGSPIELGRGREEMQCGLSMKVEAVVIVGLVVAGNQPIARVVT